MESVSQIAEALQKILNEKENILVKETKFIQQEREVKGSDFAQALIFGWLQEPEVTVEGVTQMDASTRSEHIWSWYQRTDTVSISKGGEGGVKRSLKRISLW